MSISSKQPAALSFMFLTEMWERYGFYVVQGLLVLYTTQYFGYSDDKAFSTLGAFTAMAYISPIVGGYLADRYLGFVTSVIWGGLILILGYAMLALPSQSAFLYPGLATIVIGTGMFKPSISSLLGAQYIQDDPRRDSGFTIFYIGINAGAFLAGISSGYIKAAFGWHASFLMASIGLIIGLATFLFGIKSLQHAKHRANLSRRKILQSMFFIVLAIIVISFLLKVSALEEWVLPIFGVALMIYMVMLTFQQTGVARRHMALLNLLILSSIVYWMMYFQMFLSCSLYIDRLVDKNLFGIELSTTVFYASESVFIVLLGPVLAYLWYRLAIHNKNPSTLNKFILGIFFAGLGMLVLSISGHYPNAAGKIAPEWIFFAYLLVTIGELLLSPIGLSAVTTLAPPNLVGFMMGVWFVAIGFGSLFAGIIAEHASVPTTLFVTADKLQIYSHAFKDYAFIAFFVTMVLIVAQLLVQKKLRKNWF